MIFDFERVFASFAQFSFVACEEEIRAALQGRILIYCCCQIIILCEQVAEALQTGKHLSWVTSQAGSSLRHTLANAIFLTIVPRFSRLTLHCSQLSADERPSREPVAGAHYTRPR